jgi:protein involved in polysaccharide export with SLBB domain
MLLVPAWLRNSEGFRGSERSSAAYTTILLLTCLIIGGPWEAQPARAQSPSQPADTSEALWPGDLIRLRIWREPDFSGDFGVNEAGVVILPRLGALKVSGEKPESLKVKLIREYQKFLTSSIEVVFLRRVQILGAVQKPGIYQVDPIMTIGDALALAGGISSGGREDEVQVIRAGEELPGTVSGRTVIGDSPLRSGDQLYVPERSWLSRNLGLVITGITAMTTLLYVAGR